MDRSTAIAAGFAVFAVMVMPAFAAPARADAAAEIKALEERFIAAFRAKDPDAIMQVYVPDDSLFVFDAGPRGFSRFVGAAAYHEEWRQFLADFAGALTVEMSDFALTVDHALAYGYSIQRIAGTDRQGKAIDVTACVTDVYKQIDGKWLIVHEHVSLPVDLAAGRRDPHSKP